MHIAKIISTGILVGGGYHIYNLLTSKDSPSMFSLLLLVPIAMWGPLALYVLKSNRFGHHKRLDPFQLFPKDPHTVGIRILALIGDFCQDWLNIQIVKFDAKELLKLRGEEWKEHNELMGIENEEKDVLVQWMVRMERQHKNMGPNQAFNNVISRVLITNWLKLLVGLRRNILNYHLKNPSLRNDNRQFDDMFIILGTWRSGTTLLQSLMSLDDDARILRNWEMTMPPNEDGPPASPPDYFKDPRIQIARDLHDEIRRLYPKYNENFWKIHYYEAAAPEEEVLILMWDGLMLAHNGCCGANSELNQWFICEKNKESTYRLLKLSLQYYGALYKPKTHWLLKCPLHAAYPRLLMNEFPKAKLIVCHRSPVVSTVSYAKLMAYSMVHYFDRDRPSHESGYPIPKEFGKTALQQVSHILNYFTKYRIENPQMEKQIIDCHFSDTKQDPIAQVEKIYERFGKTVTPTFRQKMEDYLKNNPRYKWGKVDYSLEETGLDRDSIIKANKDYLDMFPRYSRIGSE